MAFLEINRIEGGYMDVKLKKKVEILLFALQDAVADLIKKSGISQLSFNFLRLCSVYVFADTSKVYIVGSNQNYNGIQKAIFNESTQDYPCLENVINIVKHNISYEKLFGLEINRDLVEFVTNDNKIDIVLPIAKEYILQVRDNCSLQKMTLNPSFSGRGYVIDNSLVLFLTSGSKPNSAIFKRLICKTVHEIDSKLKCVPADDIFNGPQTIENVWAKLNQARFIIADMSGKDANVFFEAGIAYTLGKDILVIAKSIDDIPQDMQQNRYIVFDSLPQSMNVLEEQIKSVIHEILTRPYIVL